LVGTVTGLDVSFDSTISLDLFNKLAPNWRYTGNTIVLGLNTGVEISSIQTLDDPVSSTSEADWYTNVRSVDLSQYKTNCYNLCAISTETLIYPLSTNYTWLLPNLYNTTREPSYEDFQQVRNRFCFFDFIGIPCDEQVAGVINWDDKNTTLNEHASSLDEWYGSGEAVEKMISYVLHKGLGLIEE